MASVASRKYKRAMTCRKFEISAYGTFRRQVYCGLKNFTAIVAKELCFKTLNRMELNVV